MKKKLLILEDDNGLRKVLTSDFLDFNYDVFAFSCIDEVDDCFYDFAIVDLNLNNQSGLNIIPKLINKNVNCKIVILTGFGSIASAVEAIKLGAFNYILKPSSSENIDFIFKNSTESIKESHEIKRTPLSNHEYEYIQYVLNENKGNISKTAKELGLHRQSLQRKLKKNP